MKLSAYIVRVDSGFSPNPYWGVCTLACCKPVIRRMAKPGDIVVGTGSKRDGLDGHLIYAMRVANVVPYDTYWRLYPRKRPSPRSAITERGDNVWHRERGQWVGVRGAAHNGRQRLRDISGENALVAREFYYFGRDAVPIPAYFARLVATTQGHKNSSAADLIDRFWAWVAQVAPGPGRIGQPVRFDDGGCREQRCDTGR